MSAPVAPDGGSLSEQISTGLQTWPPNAMAGDGLSSKVPCLGKWESAGPCMVRFHVQEGQGQGDAPCMARSRGRAREMLLVW